MVDHVLTKVETKLWITLLLTVFSSVSMAITFYTISLQPVNLTVIMRGVIVLWSAHIPLLLGVYFKWRGLYILSFIGWMIIWTGYIIYFLQENQGMKDLVIIAWVTLAWIVSQSMAVLFQGFCYFKKRLDK